MKMTDNTVLITGGGSGIGLEIAKYFYKKENQVIICGRRLDILQEAKKMMPNLHIMICNLGDDKAREQFVAELLLKFPQLNVLVNNAGIQRFRDLTEDRIEKGNWSDFQDEIHINLEAPIHLATLLMEHLEKQPDASIINVTSGLAFVPYADVPLYSATKAGIHSFTLSLRHQLQKTSISVLEIIPPAVNTDLGGKGLHTYGVDVKEFTESVLERLADGEEEVGYGGSEEMRLFAHREITERFRMLNK